MEEENSLPLVTTTRISTVVPATPRGNDNENDNAFHLGYMGLLMKLHYIRAVYFFTAEAAQGLSDYDLKKPMFSLLDACPHVSGRIRRSESGQPMIKCNDAGVRIVESHCDDATLEECLQYQNGDSNFDDQGLVHYHVLGPDLGFSPLVFLKVRVINMLLTN